METYSYISENGTVRQIEDLIAKAKNEEQDERLDAIEHTGIIDFYSETETQTNKRWIDGKPIYRKVVVIQNPASWVQAALGVTNIETLVQASPVFYRVDGTSTTSFFRNGDDASQFLVRNISGTLYYYCYKGVYNFQKVVVVVEYTKAS